MYNETIKQFIGLEDTSYIEVEVTLDTGIIRGFTGYDYISKDMSADGYEYMSMHMWTHDVKLEDGRILKSGMHILDVDMTNKIGKKDLKNFETITFTEMSYCCECGLAHDTDDSDPTFIYHDYDIYCKGCIDHNDLLITVTDPEDIFKAPQVDEDTIKSEAIETLFCDSSGMGQGYEASLTHDQATAKVAELIEKHGTLKAGLTGVGQFQVYVTLYVA